MRNVRHLGPPQLDGMEQVHVNLGGVLNGHSAGAENLRLRFDRQLIERYSIGTLV